MFKTTPKVRVFFKIIVLLSMCLLIFAACTKEPDNNQTSADTAGANEGSEAPSSETPNDTTTESAPPSSASSEGGASLQLLSEKSLEDYSDYEEIIIDASGTSMVFTSTGTLKNVRLIGVNYNDGVFEEGLIYYTKETFTSEDAILITATIPEGTPNLLISYVDGDGNQHNYHIYRSGVDGSLILSPAESDPVLSETTDGSD